MGIFRRKHPKHDRTPWVVRVPPILQINSSIIFIALMCTIVGLSALLGLSDPQSITSQMPYLFYNLWGLVLSFAGGALVYAIVVRDVLMEKFSARILSLGLVTFCFWAVAAVGFQRSLVTLFLGACIVFLLEQRISFINVLLWARRLGKDGRGEQG